MYKTTCFAQTPPSIELSRRDPCRQKRTDVVSDRPAILFQGKMPGIEQMELQVFQIPFVGVCTFGRKYVVVLAPDDQGGWLMLAEVVLPRRIVRDIVLVVVEQGELDLGVPFARKMPEIDIPVIRADGRFVSHTVGVLPLQTVRGNETDQCLCILCSPLIPVFTDRVPELAQTFFIRIAVL